LNKPQVKKIISVMVLNE
jgi:dynein heavy chain